MDASTKRSKSKASKANNAKKDADAPELFPVGRVDPQVLKSYIDGFPDLVEEFHARPKKATTKTKNSKPSDLATLKLPTGTKPKKASPASARTKPVADDSKGGKGKARKEQSSPIRDDAGFDAFTLISQLLDRPFLPDNSIAQPKAKETKKKSSDKKEATGRSLRSSNKYALFDDRHVDSIPFSIFSIDWYISDRDYYDKKLSTILSDFEIPRENRRDGNERLYYNYLLLDSRKCRDRRGVSWESFIDSVFYLGKGKNARSKSHTKAAEEYYAMNKPTTSKKIKRIIDIWKDGYPVMLLEFARNIISEEAYTREALMIDAVGKDRSCNVIRGTYYGVASTLKPIEQRRMGVVILMEARKCFIVNGAYEEFPPEY
ncbi:hypothetical protein TSAR_004331 [Trichomalopsis sarcophagae]|uniref:Uncharacterized protein n=1 Tax=Trichomalopsis sarcophagae TaxID=543379 RepID=A0A232FN81_9HYME|nr:hypothetical protein TSAR_004331 [Trichomalopsis sarcophagae]